MADSLAALFSIRDPTSDCNTQYIAKIVNTTSLVDIHNTPYGEDGEIAYHVNKIVWIQFQCNWANATNIENDIYFGNDFHFVNRPIKVYVESQNFNTIYNYACVCVCMWIRPPTHLPSLSLAFYHLHYGRYFNMFKQYSYSERCFKTVHCTHLPNVTYFHCTVLIVINVIERNIAFCTFFCTSDNRKTSVQCIQSWRAFDSQYVYSEQIL